MALLSLQAMTTDSKLQNSLKRQYKARLIADELRQSSDDLTRLARTYVVTEDDKYEKMYWDVLAIREGNKARPIEYDRIYWDLLVDYDDKPRPDGKVKPLSRFMDEIGLTDEEKDKLREAQFHSNDLVNIEMIAMNAVKGRYQSEDNSFTRTAKPDLNYARSLLHNRDYHLKKCLIMGPIDEFYALFNRRLTNEVDSYYKEGQRYIVLISMLSVVSVVVSLVTFLLIIAVLREQKELTRQLIQSEKLSAIGQLSSGVAHEFNNILQIMSGNISVLAKHKKMKIIDYPEAVTKSLSVIKNEIFKGKQIASRMLEVAHPQDLYREKIKIKDVIEEVIELQKHDLEHEHIDIVRNYREIPEIVLDRTLVYQVMLNLIINARHAIMPKKKGRISIGVYQKNRQIIIEVEDNGIGISKENIKKIFDPFFTTKGGKAKDSLGIQGTGLGLAVSYKTIKEHKGDIVFESKINSGTKCKIMLPC